MSEDTNFLDLSGLINNYLSQIERQKEQLSKFRDMLQAIYDSDTTYQVHDLAVKEASKIRNQTKKTIQRQPEAADLTAKIMDIKNHLSELNKDLSGYLDEYAKTGQTSVETPDGKVRQIVFVAKLVS